MQSVNFTKRVYLPVRKNCQKWFIEPFIWLGIVFSRMMLHMFLRLFFSTFFDCSVSSIVEKLSKKKVSNKHIRHLVLELCCNDFDGEDVEVPFVKYKLPWMPRWIWIWKNFIKDKSSHAVYWWDSESNDCSVFRICQKVNLQVFNMIDRR